MKKILILFLLIPVNLLSQEIIGNWTGTLVFGIQKIELSILIEREGQALKASMDIPEQGVVKNKASTVFFETRNFEISFPQFNIVYKAELSEQLDLIGDFVQNGFSIPLVLKKGAIILERPQTPKGPFNYTTEDITFKNLNHMFQESLSGEISEYYINTQTISAEVLEIISSWIVGLKNKR